VSKYKNPPHNQIAGWADILEDYFGYREDGFFVEVGAYDGVLWSPGRTLALAGWDGIFFEPIARAWGKLYRNYVNYPNITCVKKAMSNFKGQAEMYSGGSLSTLKKETKELYLTVDGLQFSGLAHDMIEIVEVSILDDELLALDIPLDLDVLIIDVEGSEMDVLNEFMMDVWRPSMVVIEARERHPNSVFKETAAEINDYFDLWNYEKIYSDIVNNIYTRQT
jgi:FkbM family methyltransferase